MRVNALNANVRNFAISFNPIRNMQATRIAPMQFDTVSFTARDEKLLSADEGMLAAKKLKTSTSGYRAKLGDKFNDKFVYSMTNAVANKIQEEGQLWTVVAGDTRKATKKYAPVISEILKDRGITVLTPQLDGAGKDEISPVASPILALITKQYDIPLSVLLTASHNPWDDGGYNFLTDEGAVADDRVVVPLAENLEEITKKGSPRTPSEHSSLYKYIKANNIPVDPYAIYKNYLDETKLVDFENIAKADIDIFYEDFGGTGKYYFPRLLKDNGIEVKGLLSSKTEGPNPSKSNLKNLAQEVTKSKNPLRIGLATDGDSDRFGVVDENGNFISAPDVIMLCAYHLIKNKGMTQGTIVKNHATSSKIDAVAKYFNDMGYDIDVEQTPVGFKYLGGKMIDLEHSDKPVIVAGEESGGLTIRNHIPEKDGFVALSTLLDLVATEKKPLGVILSEINDDLGGDYCTNCINMKFATEEEKNNAVSSFDKYFNGDITQIAGFEIDYDKTYEADKKLRGYKPEGDGTKIYLKNGSSVLIRKSGTEPVMRLYVDAVNENIYDKLSNFLVSRVESMGGTIK